MDAYEIASSAPGWPPCTNVYALEAAYNGHTHLAITAMPDTPTYGPGQAQAVPCDEFGALDGDSVRAIWWAAGTFTHAGVLDLLGYVLTDTLVTPEVS